MDQLFLKGVSWRYNIIANEITFYNNVTQINNVMQFINELHDPSLVDWKGGLT